VLYSLKPSLTPFMNRPPSPRPPAFTLIELLVVISIIAVLAGLLLPVLGRIQEGANSTKCAANLRQIGTAINAYTTDSDGLLPGPLDFWQQPFTLTTAGTNIPDAGSAETGPIDRQLTRRLAKYVPQPAMGTPNERTSIFICPSFAREVPRLDAPVYVLNPQTLGTDGAPPFGDPERTRDPAKKASLSNWPDPRSINGEQPMDLSRTWAIKDADAEAFVNVAIAAPLPASTTLPRTPVHRDHRNALFYDWHVGKLDATLTRNDMPK